MNTDNVDPKFRIIRRSLSPRELQVIDGRLLAWPMKLVAFELGISEHTARHHQTNAFKKLGVCCILELAVSRIPVLVEVPLKIVRP